MNDLSSADHPRSDIPPDDSQQGRPNRSTGLRKLVVFLIAVAIATVVWCKYGDLLTIENLARHESSLKRLYQQHPFQVYSAAFLIYVVVTGLSIPGATVMSLVIGWFFSFWRGLILVSFASTSGATLAFLLSRYLLRDAIQHKFADRLSGFNESLQREGAYYLFTLRLIPAVPFFVINVVMGLMPIRVWTFWWVSQIGMLAGTCVYVYAGSQIPSLELIAEHGSRGILTPQLLAAFILLGVFPITVKKIVTRFRPPNVA